MKKLTALLLALLMMLSMAACAGTGDETPTTTEPTTEPETTVSEQTSTEQLTSLSLTLGDTFEDCTILSAYTNEDGTVTIQYMGEYRKEGNVDASAMQTLSDAFNQSGLAAMADRFEYEEGEAAGGFSASFGETYLMADFSGVIPEEFKTAFAAMDACFQTLVADLPEYVAKPMEMGEIADSDRTALNEILSNMTLEYLDQYIINGLIKDENYAYAAGLSTDSTTATALNFTSGNMTVAYSLTIATLADGITADAVAKDFEENVDWMKWVCVQPSNALIAHLGNQVLCLIGSDSLYTDTAAAIEAAGWNVVKTLENNVG